MSESKSTRSAILAELRRTQHHVPWYRRNEFVGASLLLLVICAVLLPKTASPSIVQWAVIGAFFALTLAWGGLILSDVRMPEWVKIITAFAILFLGDWLFYRYSDADWERLSHVFFNWELMKDPMEGGATG